MISAHDLRTGKDSLLTTIREQVLPSLDDLDLEFVTRQDGDLGVWVTLPIAENRRLSEPEIETVSRVMTFVQRELFERYPNMVPRVMLKDRLIVNAAQ